VCTVVFVLLFDPAAILFLYKTQGLRTGHTSSITIITSASLDMFSPSDPGADKGKAKVHPRRGHEGPEGEHRYSSTLPLASALYGVGG
jgi:hypothetical protein